MTDAVTLEAKKIWLDKFQGASLTVNVEFGNLLVQNAFKRTFYVTARNSHFISVFGRVLLGEEHVTEPENHVRNAFRNAMDDFDKKIVAAMTIVKHAEISNMASYSAARAVNAQIITPISKIHLDLLQKADQFLLLINTLWLHGEIDGRERARRELEVKRKLRGVVAATRNMFLSLRNHLNRRKPESAAEAHAEVAKLGGGPANEAAEAAAALEDSAAEEDPVPSPAAAPGTVAEKGKLASTDRDTPAANEGSQSERKKLARAKKAA